MPPRRHPRAYPEPVTDTPPAHPVLADLDWPLRTAHLVLRPARPEDAAAIWPWYGREDVQEYTTTRPADLAAMQDWWDEPSRLASTLVAERDGVIVATGMIKVQDAWGQSDVAEQARGTLAELGWTVDPGRQGEGIGTELAAALLDVAVDGLGVRRVVAECFAVNTASRRVMEKIGMRLEALHREDSLHRSGRWMDGATYAILASEHTAGARMTGSDETAPHQETR